MKVKKKVRRADLKSDQSPPQGIRLFEAGHGNPILETVAAFAQLGPIDIQKGGKSLGIMLSPNLWSMIHATGIMPRLAESKLWAQFDEMREAMQAPSALAAYQELSEITPEQLKRVASQAHRRSIQASKKRRQKLAAFVQEYEKRYGAISDEELALAEAEWGKILGSQSP